jgi:hypothetical protein
MIFEVIVSAFANFTSFSLLSNTSNDVVMSYKIYKSESTDIADNQVPQTGQSVNHRLAMN